MNEWPNNDLIRPLLTLVIRDARRRRAGHGRWRGQFRSMQRRDFLSRAAGATALAFASAGRLGSATTPQLRYTAAIIGHTGRGNYGHGMDVVFNDRPGIEIVGVADPGEAGRAKAQQRV